MGIPSIYIDWDKQPLGEMPDSELAEKLGTVSNHVAYRRRLKQIPNFTKESICIVCSKKYTHDSNGSAGINRKYCSQRCRCNYNAVKFEYNYENEDMILIHAAIRQIQHETGMYQQNKK